MTADAIERHRTETQTQVHSPSEKRLVTGMGLTELMTTEFPECNWIVPGLIAEGLTTFSGRPKCGKSWAALGLALGKSSGGCVLGELKCTAAPTLYLALEDSLSRVKLRLEKLGAESNEFLRIETVCPRADRGGLEQIESWLAAQRTPGCLVVVDTWARIRPFDNGRRAAYDSDTAFLSPVQQLAMKYQSGILLLHHTRKAGAVDFVDAVNGSTGITAVSDAILVLERPRGKNEGVLKGTGRDLGEFEKSLRFDPTTGQWTGSSLPPAALLTTSEQRAVVSALNLVPDGLSVSELARTLQQSETAIANKLRRLEALGIVQQEHRRGPYRIASQQPLL